MERWECFKVYVILIKFDMYSLSIRMFIYVCLYSFKSQLVFLKGNVTNVYRGVGENSRKIHLDY